MFNDARANGLALFVREGYRTAQDQQQIMNERIREYENQGYSKPQATKMAEKYVAIPGTSEHQLGLSVDINANQTKCSSEKVYSWLDNNAYKYGFIKRYPSNKSYITRIHNEPWHYRYVGKEAAATMKNQNLCLEEYLKKYK
jgi:D-alanyl-D-alanine carboxypeptidase